MAETLAVPNGRKDVPDTARASRRCPGVPARPPAPARPATIAPVIPMLRKLALPPALVAIALAAMPADAGALSPNVDGMRVGVYDTRTRFVVDLDRPATFSVFTLSDPYRVVVDLPEVTWSSPLKRVSGGLIARLRFGLLKPGVSRIVLDVGGPVRVLKSFLLAPAGASRHHRLVIDLVPTDRKTFMREIRARLGTARTAPPRAPPVPRPKPRGGKKLVMIDPGHGGVDPGAISRSGQYEKHVVLAHARELRRQLLAAGNYRVVMTRNRDVFVRLRKRIQEARAAGADLFISLHADSTARPSVRGASVYTLSERASDREAAALAARENKSDIIAGLDLDARSDAVTDILIDLSQRDTKNRSAQFAGILIHEMAKVRSMLRNTHRFAGFAVLKAPDVPAVLVELGYLSNRADERLLFDAKARRRLMSAIVRAIDRYFGSQ